MPKEYTSPGIYPAPVPPSTSTTLSTGLLMLPLSSIVTAEDWDIIQSALILEAYFCNLHKSPPQPAVLPSNNKFSCCSIVFALLI